MSADDTNFHYYEAERLLRLAGVLLQQMKRRQPGDAQQASLERELTHVENQARDHAVLAGISVPARTAPVTS